MIGKLAHIALLTGTALLTGATAAIPRNISTPQPTVVHRAKPVVEVGGLVFHDLNGDGQLAPYEDWRLTPEVRAADLAARMTLAEKAGLLMHGTPPTVDKSLRGAWDLPKLRDAIANTDIRFFINRLGGDPTAMARSNNAAQEMAEATRLGIPVVFSSDPRSQVQSTFGLSVDAGRFSLWPEFTGLAAIGDPALVERHARIVAAEYRAVGISMALSPQADLATEPRWPRINGTFGDDPAKVASMVGAYVTGMQGGRDGVRPTGVATVVKHWLGYGAEPEGYDAHNPYGRMLRFSTDRNLALHVVPFRAAFAAHAAGVMPTYAILPANVTIAGHPAAPVGAGFNKALLTDLLRNRYGFAGIILSDWKITDDCGHACETGTTDIDAIGMPWGVETLTKEQRFAKALNAGVDQFGGVMDAEIIVRLVQAGEVTEARVDQSVRRLLTLMFRLGLFENAYVDADAALRVVGSATARAAGLDAQRRSLTLLANRDNLLPLARGKKVWLVGIARPAAVAAGLVPVDRPEDAEVALMRVATPFTQHRNFFFGARHHEGMPQFLADNADKLAIERAARAGKPVIASVYLDRPAILTSLLPYVGALLGDYGVQDSALLDVVTGRSAPEGHLPFELPRSAEAVTSQQPDVPSDSINPLFKRGFGLRYGTTQRR
jgi:beta-glucosidase